MSAKGGQYEFAGRILTPAAGPALADIRIELRRGPVAINVTWPMAGAHECAVWMREILR